MGNHSLVLSGAANRCRTVVLEWSFNMRKGNIIAGLICAAVAVYVIVTCLGYPRAEVYGTGVPGPGLWPGIIAALLLICSVGLIVVTLMMKKDQFPELPMWTPGTKTCIHFHGDPACIHAGIIYTWIYHPVSDHAVRFLPVVP